MLPRTGWVIGLAILAGGCERAAVSSGSECSLTVASADSMVMGDTIVADPPLCSPEVIQLEHLVTLGGDEPEALTNSPMDIAVDSRGRFYLLASNSGIERPVVYSSDGHFITALGGIGDGPGEFRMPGALMVGPGDTIFIFDMISRRISVFTPNYDFVRALPLPGRLESATRVALLLPDGRFAANMDARVSRDNSGPSLHLIEQNGAIVRSFGNDSVPIRRWVDGARRMRTLGWSRRGFWSGTLLFEYRVELWDSAGTRIKLLRRRPDWFLPYDTLMSASPDHSPYPALVALMEDGGGRLWTISRVADSQWVEGLSKTPIRGEGGTQYYRVEDPEAASDSYLEILDPVSGRLLVSRRFDGIYTTLINDTLLGRNVQDENGIPAVEIYGVRLSP